jgi:TRAP-type C4-dicarboxylate transport system permease small subunit
MRVAELKNESSSAPTTFSDRGPLFYIGAFGLIAVMTVETIAVIGRHLGWPLLGAIEMIQAAILLSACAATVIATLNRAHATVHLLTDRLSPTWRALLARIASLLATLFFAGLAAGAIWLASDFWQAHEESEVLHISFRPLRVITALAALSVAAIFAYRAFHKTRASQ